MTKKGENSNEALKPKLGISGVSGSLPSVDEAGVAANVKALAKKGLNSTSLNDSTKV
jgi:hypothetical protein